VYIAYIIQHEIIAYLVNELGNILQKQVIVSFKIQCCYSPVVIEDNHKSLDSRPI